jgi:hypothetical protein
MVHSCWLVWGHDRVRIGPGPLETHYGIN